MTFCGVSCLHHQSHEVQEECFILKMEALHFSKTLVIIYQSPWSNISKDLNLHQHFHKSLTSQRNRLFKNYSKGWHVKHIILCLHQHLSNSTWVPIVIERNRHSSENSDYKCLELEKMTWGTRTNWQIIHSEPLQTSIWTVQWVHPHI
jgi:hypothetical protein